jgi:hypothetical protein
MPLGAGNVLASVEDGGQPVVAMLMRNQRIRLEHCFEPADGITRLISHTDELFEMPSYLPLVPGDQDRLDVRKVLIQRGPSDAGRLGDLGHRYRDQPVLLDESGGRVEGRLADGATMRIDRLGPQPWHPRRIHAGALRDVAT